MTEAPRFSHIRVSELAGEQSAFIAKISHGGLPWTLEREELKAPGANGVATLSDPSLVTVFSTPLRSSAKVLESRTNPTWVKRVYRFWKESSRVLQTPLGSGAS